MVSYYAHLDKNNVVTQVVTGVDETEIIEGLPAVDWYSNLLGVKNVVTYIDDPEKTYAGIGYIYDADLDKFVAPLQPEFVPIMPDNGS